MSAVKTDIVIQNKIFYGDNLDVMNEKIANESIDLIYLDPPFNSKGNYNQIYKTETGQPVPEQAIAFCDAWELNDEREKQIKHFHEDLISDKETNFAEFWNAWVKALRYQDPKTLAYLVFMARRLRIMKYKLKKTGSIFLHCDPTASHYIKITMDGIFGHDNFRNEIIWHRTNNPKGSQFKAKKLGASTDHIFWYTKTKNYNFDLDCIKTELTKEEIEKKYPKIDEFGRYCVGPIECGASMGSRPTLCYEYKGYTNKYSSGWRMTKANLTKLDLEGNLGWSSTGRPFRKLRPSNDKGHPLDNLWIDINRLYHSKEKIGYPTQKPVALLERIIKMCTKEGDTVLDPFCGCGTTLEAAQNLKRKWVGIDICLLSTSLIENRLKNKFPIERMRDYIIDGMPVTMEQVKALIDKKDSSKSEGRYQFQYWAIEKVKGFANTKKGADGGIDGSIYFYKDEGKTLGRMILSVKSGHLKSDDIRALKGVMETHDADMAGLICYENPTKNMIDAANDAGYFQLESDSFLNVEKYRKIQIITAEEILKNPEACFHIPPTPLQRRYR